MANSICFTSLIFHFNKEFRTQQAHKLYYMQLNTDHMKIDLQQPTMPELE